MIVRGPASQPVPMKSPQGPSMARAQIILHGASFVSRIRVRSSAPRTVSSLSPGPAGTIGFSLFPMTIRFLAQLPSATAFAGAVAVLLAVTAAGFAICPPASMPSVGFGTDSSFIVFSSLRKSRAPLDRLKGTQNVEHAGALEVRFASKVRCCLAKNLFDLRRPPHQLTVARHQHRGCSADVRSGETGAIAGAFASEWKGSIDLFPRRD